MTTRENDDDCRLGFLAAIEVPERGYIGGLLVTNRFGRPLEFQCTTPVKPNRTQEILYGPTLIPFVLGELIGRTLLEKVGVKPHFVLTESSEVLEVRKHVGLPVAFLVSEREVEAADDSPNKAGDNDSANDEVASADTEMKSSDESGGAEVPSAKRKSTSRKLRFHKSHQTDRDEIEGRIAALPREVDLREPFERVREALEETTRTGTAR